MFWTLYNLDYNRVQSAGIVEFNDSILCEGVRPPPNGCPGFVKESTGVYLLWIRPYFSSSVSHGSIV